MAEPALFQSLLGSAFEDLPATVRVLHLRPGTAEYAGEVEVARGSGSLSRLFAWCTGLPPTGTGRIRVVIEASPTSERWTRHVGAHAMRSRLRASGGLLVERLGLVEFRFRLTVDERRLVWRVTGVRALGLPLPARWFAGVNASESEAEGRYTFDGRARLPLVGAIVDYRGWLDVRR